MLVSFIMLLCYNYKNMIITGKKFSKPAMSRVINGDVILEDAPKKTEKFRLDHLLVEKYKEYNRSTLQNFIKSGFVTVNGKIAKKPNSKIEATDLLELHLPKKEIKNYQPKVIYEDQNVLVLDKPNGLLSMKKGEYSDEITLENFGLLVHRLDRDTSGVVILAKNTKAQTLLRKQFQDRKTKKTYYAIVEGRPKLDEALIDLPIMRNLKHPTTFVVEAGGKPSKTHYKIINSNNHHSLLELKPTTGRTHQLRVHLKYLGTPILGDRVYGSAPKDTNLRLYLHASKLEITIPDGMRKTFVSAIPLEFQEILSLPDLDHSSNNHKLSASDSSPNIDQT